MSAAATLGISVTQLALARVSRGRAAETCASPPRNTRAFGVVSLALAGVLPYDFAACLARWAQLKGIAVVGTGDFTHPAWFAELKEKLVPAEDGLFRLRDDLAAAVEREVPAACRRPVRFLLQSGY